MSNNSDRIHDLAKEYLLKTFDFNKTPEEFAKNYISISSKINSVFEKEISNNDTFYSPD